LEVKVGFEISVSILFGLAVSIEAMINNVAEVFMENSLASFLCVWCGVAFLRALVWDTSNPDERLALMDGLLDPGETRGGAIPSPRTKEYRA
jgi:hypothetical protein